MVRRKTEQQKAAELKCKEEANKIINQKLRLIQMVCEYPIIYNKGHPDHLNSEMKTIIWEQIATELNEEGTFEHFLLISTIIVQWHFVVEYNIESCIVQKYVISS